MSADRTADANGCVTFVEHLRSINGAYVANTHYPILYCCHYDLTDSSGETNGIYDNSWNGRQLVAAYQAEFAAHGNPL